MSNRKISTATKALIKAKESIQDKNNWWGYQKLTKTDPEQACALQALARVKINGLSAYGLAIHKLHKAAKELYNTQSIVDVNDYVGHEAVMKCYDRAIEDSIKESNK